LIGDREVQLIASSLPNIKKLSLNSNQVSSTGIGLLSRKCLHLKELSISDNELGLEGAIAIARHLPVLNQLAIGTKQPIQQTISSLTLVF
jgi:hypothetical protein